MTAANTTAPATTAPPSAPTLAARLGMPGLGTMLRIDTLLWLRHPVTVFFGLLFPVLLIAVIGFVIPTTRTPLTDLPGGSAYDGMTAIQVMVPAILAVGIAPQALFLVPVTIAEYREQGVLRRLAATPMRPQGIVTTTYVINLTAALVATIAALALAIPAFGVPAPRSLPLVLLGFLGGFVSLFAIGTLIAALVPRSTTASALGNLIFIPLQLLAGLWIPLPAMPETLRDISTFSPLGAASQLMTHGWFEAGLGGGTPFPWLHVAVIAGWTLLTLALGITRFRWE